MLRQLKTTTTNTRQLPMRILMCKINDISMAPTTGTVTRRAAKGIPPRVRSPPRAKRKPAPKQAGINLKRHASESSDDEREHWSDSDDSRSREKQKRHGKRRCTEKSEEEEEIVDEEADAERSVEEVEDIQDEQSGDEVSRLESPATVYSCNSSLMMGLTTINVVKPSKKCW